MSTIRSRGFCCTTVLPPVDCGAFSSVFPICPFTAVFMSDMVFLKCAIFSRCAFFIFDITSRATGSVTFERPSSIVWIVFIPKILQPQPFSGNKFLAHYPSLRRGASASVPQIVVVVIRTMASVACNIAGFGLSSNARRSGP